MTAKDGDDKKRVKDDGARYLQAIRDHGSIAEAARALDVPVSTFRSRLRAYGVEAEAYRLRDEHPARGAAKPLGTLLAALRDVDGDRAVALVGAHGWIAAAKELGVSRTAFRDHVERLGVMERAKGAAEGQKEVREVELLRHRNRELEAATKRQRESEVTDERYIRRVENAVPAIKPRYAPAPPVKHASEDAHEFVLLFSDAHAGEVVTSQETLGMNVYDWNVMLERMGRIQRSVLSYQEHRPYPVAKLHIAMLGDNLSGSIHEDLAVTNEKADAEATVQLGSDAAAWIEEFVPHFPSIAITGISGNHPRRTKKSSHKRPFNNDDYVAYHIMRAYLRNYDSITFDIPASDFGVMTVAERWRFLLMHGDGIRSTMPGVPWGGVLRRITTLEAQFAAAGQALDYALLGHFHSANALDGVGVKTFMNGALKGVDGYSLKQFGSGRPPRQLLLTVHPRKGVTDVSYLDPEPVESATQKAHRMAARFAA